MVWMTRRISAFNLKWKNSCWPFTRMFQLSLGLALSPVLPPRGGWGRGYISAKVEKCEQTSTFIAMHYQGYMSIKCTLLLPECTTCHSLLANHTIDVILICSDRLWHLIMAREMRTHWPREVLQKGQSWEASDSPERPGQSQLGHTTSVLRRKMKWLWVWGFTLFLQVSQMLPQSFRERHVRIYCKKLDQPSLQAARK